MSSDNYNEILEEPQNRRNVLKGVGALLTGGTAAGCLGGNNSDQKTTNSTQTPQDTPGNTDTATSAPTQNTRTNQTRATETQYDTETTTEPGTPENTETSTSTETSEPTTHTTTTPEEPRIVDSPYDNPFHYVPDPEFFLEDSTVTPEDKLELLPIVHKNYQSIREDVSDEAWQIIKENEGGPNEYSIPRSDDRSKKPLTGITLDDVIDWTSGKAGGELIKYDKTQEEIEEGLKAAGENSRGEYQQVEEKHGWNIFKGYYFLDEKTYSSRGMAAVRGNRAIFTNAMSPKMRESERKNIGINDQEELMNIWIKSVNEAAEGESGLPSYAENNDRVAQLEQLYTNNDYDSIIAIEEALRTESYKKFISEGFLYDYSEDSYTINYRGITEQRDVKSPEKDRFGNEFPLTKEISEENYRD